MSKMIMLEGAKATTETVDALRTGAAAMKAMQKATYVSTYLIQHLIRIFTFGFTYRVLVVISSFSLLLCLRGLVYPGNI